MTLCSGGQPDRHFTSRYEDLGFCSSADFIEFGRCFGVGEAKARYLSLFKDRL